MNILLANFYYKPALGGVENSLFHVARSWQMRGHRVQILASDRAPTIDGRLSETETMDKIPVRRFKTSQLHPAFGPLHSLRNTQSAERAAIKLNAASPFDFALVRHHTMVNALRDALPNLPVVYVIPSVEANYHRPLSTFNRASVMKSLKTTYIREVLIRTEVALSRRAMLSGCRLSVLSQNVREQVKAFLGPNSPAIQIIPPGVDSDRFSPDLRDEAFREKWGLSPKMPGILLIGRLVPQKAFHVAIQAFAYLQRQFQVFVVGDGTMRGMLEALAHEIGLEDRIHFLGWVPNPAEVMASTDLMIMSSVEEAFGQTIIEAMASGLPVVAFRPSADVSTATDEILEDGKTGFLCDFGVEPLAAAITRALDLSEESRNAIGNNARYTAQHRYSWDAFADSVMELACEKGPVAQ